MEIPYSEIKAATETLHTIAGENGFTVIFGQMAPMELRVGDAPTKVAHLIERDGEQMVMTVVGHDDDDEQESQAPTLTEEWANRLPDSLRGVVLREVKDLRASQEWD